MSITGRTRLAGVVGHPVTQSLSPVLHNAWLEAAGLDGVYVAFSVSPDRFRGFLDSLRGSSVAGLNITVPFKQMALAAADQATPRAQAAKAANVVIFQKDGTLLADNTDGEGLIWAFKSQAPTFSPATGPVAIIGAGGGAMGAAAALLAAGCPEVRIFNRTLSRAQALAEDLGDRVRVHDLSGAGPGLADVTAVINATSAGLADPSAQLVSLESAPQDAVIMDMTYKPLRTHFLKQGEALGRRTVDGLGMLIGQARPAFEAFFGQAPSDQLDVRALALAAMESPT